ncbi:MAG: transaldolase [Actinobacteria bacterium]|nr:transaldolase [Actinomycetota bacterium]
MSRLNDLHDQYGQSPWLDNLRRGWITSGELQRWIDRGVRGITSNPSIFQKAMSGASDYDEQFRDVVSSGDSPVDAYWDLVVSDIEEALRLLRPVYDSSGGGDGFVSVEVAPELARDTEGTVAAARDLHRRIDEPNLYVKIPGTAEGVAAIRQMIAEGHSINVTLLFSLKGYEDVIEAYLSGLEELVASGADPTHVRSVASFFVSRVDTEVDRRLDGIGTAEARALKHKAAVANAQLAYELFLQRFSGPRWDALAARGCAVQRPLWASTSTKSPDLPDTLYVDTLIAPNTVNTMPEGTLEAFDEHGTLARTADADLEGAHRVMEQLDEVGVDMDDVGRVLEDEGVAAFAKAFDELISTLDAKAHDMGVGG